MGRHGFLTWVTGSAYDDRATVLYDGAGGVYTSDAACPPVRVRVSGNATVPYTPRAYVYGASRPELRPVVDVEPDAFDDGRSQAARNARRRAAAAEKRRAELAEWARRAEERQAEIIAARAEKAARWHWPAQDSPDREAEVSPDRVSVERVAARPGRNGGARSGQSGQSDPIGRSSDLPPLPEFLD